MDDLAIQQFLRRAFERHEIELEPDEDWLVTEGDFPAIRGHWVDGTAGQPGRLDIDVVLDEERRIEDSFAGADAREALEAFMQHALHPLLAACWYATDERRLRIEAWEIGVRTWDVFAGAFAWRGVGAEALAATVDALDAIADVLRRESLTPALHWLRLFASRTAAGAVRVEALLDNEPWAAGTQALAALAWPVHAHDYSAQALILLDVRDY
jgi:Family of unknown function (DUF6348)